MQISVTISGLSRLFGDDLAALVDVARVADDAGIDQLVMTDHLAIGPAHRPLPVRRRSSRTRRGAVAGAADASSAAFAAVDDPGPARHRRPHRAGAPGAARGQDGRDPRRPLARPGRPRDRDRLAARGVHRSRASVRRAAPHGWRTLVRACRALWEEEPPVSFTSDSVSFTDLWCEPRPVQSRVPIWFSGPGERRTVRRVAELGDGWLPLAIPLDEVTATIDKLRTAFARRRPRSGDARVRQGLAVRTDDDGRVDLDATLGAGRRTSRRVASRPFRSRSAASCAAGTTSSRSCGPWVPPSRDHRTVVTVTA